ncbi:MAG: acyl carrier protein [Gammaproteobacteria bacterium]|nr:acyl carrier protein [Gammaproteobacteria bacterium]
MLDSIEVVAALKKILNERFGVDPSGLNEDSRLQDVGVDSLHVLHILLDMETLFDIKLDELSLSTNPSLGEIRDLVCNSAAIAP